ncbi:MAG TPA: pseudouridine synthase [Mycobacteriales bacterium]|nr:pseudouridine synthase [Mycobacteriales bacterium]
MLASAGVGSRRAAEELISAGRVQVNGETVRTLGVRVDPDRDVIHVDGLRVSVRADLTYLALNKPPGILSAMSDDRGRPTVGDYVVDRGDRLFHVGRLDQDSEGLLLLTNDGELANRLMHPRYEVIKTYLAEVPAPVPRDLGRTLLAGVELPDGPVRIDRFRLVDASGGRALVELQLHEGRKHLVRRLLAQVGHPVSRLVRTEIGPVRLGHQRQGTVRHLSAGEIGHLYRLVGL